MSETIKLYKEATTEKASPEVEANWNRIWKEICMTEDGQINLEQIKRELFDFSFIMHEVATVYCHITGNRMSKPNYHANTVIDVMNEVQDLEREQQKLDDKEDGQCSLCGQEIK